MALAAFSINGFSLKAKLNGRENSVLSRRYELREDLPGVLKLHLPFVMPSMMLAMKRSSLPL